jgi:group I intron endonuclease
MLGYIYRWRNVATDWSYIGSTLALLKRRNLHLCLLRGKRHHARHLQAAWSKYGETSFVFEVVAEVDCENELALREVENDWLVKFAGTLYNAAPQARSVLGLKRSAETRAKISAALRGMKRSIQARARMSQAQKRRAPPSPDSIAKMREKLKGRKLSASHRALIAESNRRRPVSELTRQKIRAAHRGRTRSEESRAKQAAAMRGRKQSHETRRKRSLALKGRPKSAEAVARQSASLSGRPNGALLLSPDGEVHRVLNGSAFAREHGLKQKSVSAVIVGARKSHRGWTLLRTEEGVVGQQARGHRDESKDCPLRTVRLDTQVPVQPGSNPDFRTATVC